VSTKLDEIKAAIKSIAESITDIGNVYGQMPNVTMWDSVFDSLVKDGTLKVLLFTKESHTPVAISEGFKKWEIQHDWLFKYIHSSHVENETDVIFDNICESICSTYDSNERLNNTVKRKQPMFQLNKGYVMTCRVLCHYTEFKLTTFSNL